LPHEKKEKSEHEPWGKPKVRKKKELQGTSWTHGLFGGKKTKSERVRINKRRH